jgi:DegV family protein with EDD domain
MSNIKIITDSTSDLTPEMAKKMDITVIPLSIIFGEKEYKDGVDLTPNEFYKLLADPDQPWPRTNQPTPKDFHHYYQEAIDEGYDSILSIHITPNMSGTVNSANIASKNFSEDKITIIDSNTVTHPLGLIVYETAVLLKEGLTEKEIIERIQQDFIPNARIISVIDSLDNLYRGGRIGRAQKFFGTLLKMKPLMRVHEGFVESFGKTRGHDEAFKKLVKMAPKIFDNLLTDRLWVGYTDRKDESKKLLEEIEKIKNCPSNVRLVRMGPSIGTHVGLGMMSFSWIGDCNLEWYFEG